MIVGSDVNQDKLADLISDSGDLGQASGEEMPNNNPNVPYEDDGGSLLVSTYKVYLVVQL